MGQGTFNRKTQAPAFAAGAVLLAILPGLAPVNAQDNGKFESLFEDIGPASTDIPPEDGAVDLESFEPKRERPPEPKAEPTTSDGKVIRSLGTGVASYYGKRFHGRLTANGERFNMNAMTAAHKTLPFGTKVRVTYPRNGRSVVVRINDRGPFIRGRHIDLSRKAAQKLGMISSGHARVKMEIVS